MSHRDDCPDRWTAEREGRDDAHRRSFLDRDHFDCEEAQRSYEDGFRREQRREEERRDDERREEEANERRLQARREEERAEEEYYRQQEEEWQPPEPSERELCAVHAHAEYMDAVDRFGRRCYCGAIRWLTEVA